MGLRAGVRLDTTTAVATPERVRFRYRIAGPGRRAFAWACDALIQLAVLLVMGLFALALSQLGLEGVGMGGLFVGVFLLQWFYGAFFETALAGRTPGKLLMGLRVVTLEGSPARPQQYVLRNLLTGADFLPVGFGVGVAAMLVDDKLRRVGDWVAGTVVVDESRADISGGVAIEPPVTEEERRALPASVKLTRDERRTIEDFLRRRHSLSDGRAKELAQILAAPLGAQIGFEHPDPERLLVLAYARASGRDRALEEGV